MSTIGHENGRGGYHGHPNTVAMMGCSRAKQVYWLHGCVRSRVVIQGWAQAESFASLADVSWRARWTSETTRGGGRSCRRGKLCSAGHGVRPLTVSIPRAVPVAVIAGTNFLVLVERLLLLQLRFLITSVLRDRGRVMPWGFCRGENTGFSKIPNGY